MSARKQPNKSKAIEKSEPIVFFCDGAGARPDGTGSGFAWYRADNKETKTEWISNLTNNQAEYHAILSALSAAPRGATVEIRSDSELACNQLLGRYKIFQPRLEELHAQILKLCKQKDLKLSIRWIPRNQNLADALLSRKIRQEVDTSPVVRF